MFTICIILYWISYVILVFEFPKINFIKTFKDEDNNFETMPSIAHVLSAFSLCLLLAIIIFLIAFAKHIK